MAKAKNGYNKKKLRSFGFWWSDREPELPHPSAYVDETWDAEERRQVVEYIREAPVYLLWKGWSWCRFGCKGHFGTKDLTDGAWIFPEGLAHYVECHGVKPSDDFLAHIRGNEYQIPDIPWLRAHIMAALGLDDEDVAP